MEDLILYDEIEENVPEQIATGSEPAIDEVQDDEGILDESAGSDPEQVVLSEGNNDEIVEKLEEINESVKELNENVLRNMDENKNVSSNVSDDNSNDNNDEIEYLSVSENTIMDKPISEYTVTESLLMFISLGILIAGLVLIIKKGVPRWR